MALRAAEGILGPGILGLLLWPVAACWGATRVARGVSEMTGGPAGLDRRGWWWRARAETGAVMTGLAWVFRDRFATGRWRHRISTEGAGPIEAALAAGRPVVVATAHTEAMKLLARVLCARGMEAATLVEDAARHSRRFAPGPGEEGVARARVIGVSDLRGAAEFLRGPRVLVVSIDAVRGKCVRTESGHHGVECLWATGAARLARRSGAVCLSGVVLARGRWKYRAEFGAPVAADQDAETTTAALGLDILNLVLARPECWGGVLRGAVRARDQRGGASPPGSAEGARACPSAA